MMPGGGMVGGGSDGAEMMGGGMGNMMSMPHPMHLHGFLFRVTERSGSPAHIKRLAVDSRAGAD